MPNPSEQPFIPALRYGFLDGIYDRFAPWVFSHTAFRHPLESVMTTLPVNAKGRILDLGCGPGQLAIRMKQTYPSCNVTAVDLDATLLKRASAKANAAGVDVTFINQDISALSLNESFDYIYSTLVFHHLTPDTKAKTLDSITQRLNPGASFVLVDFCQAKTTWERLKFIPVQLFDGAATTLPHIHGWLEQTLPQHFKSVTIACRVSTQIGPVAAFVCSNPLTSPP